MNLFMMIAVVPQGFSGKVTEAAARAGALHALVIRARGASDLAKEGPFRFRIEPEEEIVLVKVTREIAETASRLIHEEFDQASERGGSLYLIPLLS